MIGILALQGGFSNHARALNRLAVPWHFVKKKEDLKDCSGLIIPGGESTAIRKQIAFLEMERELTAFAEKKPIFGTCAGLILMARHIEGEMNWTLGLLDISIERNAYGRQVDSFFSPLNSTFWSSSKVLSGMFIRAPRITAFGKGVEVLAEHGGFPVLVEQGYHLGATFHPELSDCDAIHEYFVEKVRNMSKQLEKLA